MPVQALALTPPTHGSGFALREAAPPNVWVLPELHCVIDTGLPIPQMLQDILTRTEGWPKLEILITHNHPDHTGNLADLLAARPEATLWAPASVALIGADIRSRLVVTTDGASVGTGGLRALATPGHTADHMAYWLPGDLLAAGDLILGEGTPWVGPPEGDLGDYLQSLNRVARLPGSLRLLGGHGAERPSAQALAEATYSHRMMREAMILALWAEGMRDCRQIATEIYQVRERLSLDAMRFEMAVWTVTGHVEFARRRHLI